MPCSASCGSVQATGLAGRSWANRGRPATPLRSPLTIAMQSCLKDHSCSRGASFCAASTPIPRLPLQTPPPPPFISFPSSIAALRPSVFPNSLQPRHLLPPCASACSSQSRHPLLPGCTTRSALMLTSPAAATSVTAAGNGHGTALGLLTPYVPYSTRVKKTRARKAAPPAATPLEREGGGGGGSGVWATEAEIKPEAAAYWRQMVDRVDRPGLSSLVGSLDWGHPLGLTRRRAGKRVQCYGDFLAAKKHHPTAVVLVRIGDFYEAVGFDALVLCQHCTLNPMTPQSGVAEAGFPRAGLRRYLNRLIESNFTVAIVEEIRTVQISAVASKKERKLMCLVSASSPYYLYGDVEDEYEGDDTPLPRTITGVSYPSEGGYRLLRYCPQRRGVVALSQLSLEALVAHLHASGLAQPLHLHTSVREREAGKSTSLARVLAAMLGTSVAEYGPGAGPEFVGLGGGARGAGPGAVAGSDVEGFKRVVARQLGLDRHQEAEMKVSAAEASGDTPIPPSLSTITQLGLAGARGVPSLLSAALPDGTPAPAREWLRRLLLLPPPPAVAEDIRMVCQQLAEAGEGALALPPLVTSVPGPRIMALLGEGAAGHNTLRELRVMLDRVVELLQLPGERAHVLHCAVGQVLEWGLNVRAGVAWQQVHPRDLAAQCAAVSRIIGDVVPQLEELAELGEGPGREAGSDDEEAEPGDGDAAPAPPHTSRRGASPAATAGSELEAAIPPSLRAFLTAPPPSTCEPGLGAFGGGGGGVARRLSPALRLEAVSEAARLLRRMEKFRKSVREERMPEVFAKLLSARHEMVAALLQLAEALEAAAREVGAAAEAVVRMAPHDDAVWGRVVVRTSKGYKKLTGLQTKVVVDSAARLTGVELVHPLNRKRSVEGDRLSTPRLEAAATAYREAAEQADKEARRLLRDLCRQLYGGDSGGSGGQSGGQHLVTLLAANELSVSFTALERHVARTKQTGWNWPAMPAWHQLAQPGGPEGGRNVRLCLPGLWPYWMDRRDAVLNDVELRAGRLALLTGPNMAGKSTVLRSIAAATLLATCGLSLPAGTMGQPPLGPAAPAAAAASRISHAQTPSSGSRELVNVGGQAFGVMLRGGHTGGPVGGAGVAAGEFSVSWVSHVSLRNFSGDSPLEGKSAFAVEMEDTAHTLAVARSSGRRCLVLLDELGKGTEVVAGSALAAAIVEDLAAAGAAGVFATHLHDLVYLLDPLRRAGQLDFWAMEVQRWQRPGVAAAAAAAAPVLLRPTRRVLVGQVCLRSLALQVAAECGMQPGVLARAAAHEQALGVMMHRARKGAYGLQDAASSAASAGGDSVDVCDGGMYTAMVAAGGGGGVAVPGLQAERLLREEAAEWAEAMQEAEAEAVRALEGVEAGVGRSGATPAPVSASSDAAPELPAPRQQQRKTRKRATKAVVEADVKTTVVEVVEVASGGGGGVTHGSVAAVAPLVDHWAAVMPGDWVSNGADALGGSSSGAESDGEGGAANGSHSSDEEEGVVLAAAEAGAGSPKAAQRSDGGIQDGGQALALAAGLLRDHLRSALARAQCEMGPETGQLHWVRPEWRPSPGHSGEAVVYVLLRWDGLLYVGESEDISARLKTHRATETRERRSAGKQLLAGRKNVTSLQCVYVVVPRHAGGKSTALDVEADLIAQLQRGGWELRSDHDKKRSVLHRPQLPGQQAAV